VFVLLKKFLTLLRKSGLFSNKKGKVVVIETYGGLGNQILSLILGLYCRDVHNRSLRVDITYLDEKHSPGFNFTSLIWNGEIEVHAPSSRGRAELYWKIMDSLSFRFLNFRKIETKCLGMYREIYWPLRSIEDLSTILKSHKLIRFRGFYFQKMFAEELRSRGLLDELRVVQPSKQYLDLELERDSVQPIAIHIRRGDYTRDGFGQLSEDYYLKVVDNLAQTPPRPLWIFASSMEVVDELPILKSFSSKIVTSETLENPAESLALFSRCSILVLSNSSFCYVSALFSDGEIYAPWPFSPKHSGLITHTQELVRHHTIPHRWKVVESKWEQ